MTIEEYLERKQKEIDAMTLKQARDIIASRLSHDDMQIEFEKAVKMLLDCADKALEQEPKTGHWIDRDVYDADRWKCSECGRTEQYQENFCPNCGAKMEEVEE